MMIWSSQLLYVEVSFNKIIIIWKCMYIVDRGCERDENFIEFLVTLGQEGFLIYSSKPRINLNFTNSFKVWNLKKIINAVWEKLHSCLRHNFCILKFFLNVHPLTSVPLLIYVNSPLMKWLC